METKHTPGQWDVAANPPHGMTAICRHTGTGWDLVATAKEPANARLIAAAPELLEAAQLVIDWFEAERDHDKAGFSERMEMCDASEAAIRAAIAKATGSQP